MNEDERKHHVAWADRIGLNKQWGRDIISCSEAFGTEYYDQMVERFRNNIINIRNGPLLSDTIDNYIDTDLKSFKDKSFDYWADNNPQDTQDEDLVIKARKRIDTLAYIRLYKYMLQLLEDNGFGYYMSIEVKRGKDGYKHYDDDEYDYLD